MNQNRAYEDGFKKKNPYEKKEIDFFGRKFFVDERVYEPTVETEAFVKEILDKYKKFFKENKGLIVDVGTGSGVVGITLSKELNRKVIGVDISKEALEVALLNKQKYFDKGNTGFEILQSDYVKEIKEEPIFIIADLPFGSPEYLLDSNKGKDWTKMPSISFFPKEGGPMGSYKDLVSQIIQKGWKTILCIETGNMPESLVRAELPNSLSVLYKKLKNNDSITTIKFLND